MSMESYRLAELKYAIFRTTGRKTKKLPRSKLFLWTIFKHGLLEGSAILLQYSAITHTPLESSPLGELKYAISPGYEVRPKNKTLRKCKKMPARPSYMVTVLRTGSDKFGQVWTSQNRCEALFSSTVSRTLSKFGPAPKPACSFLTVPRSKLYDPPKWWKQRFVTFQLA